VSIAVAHWQQNPYAGDGKGSKMSNQLKLSEGHSHLIDVVYYWISKSSLTYPQFCKIVDWGLGEKGWVESTNLCRFLNAKTVRGCSVKNLLGFEAANEVIWKWQTSGKEDAEKAFGSGRVWGVKDEWVRKAVWLPINGSDCLPLRFTDFASVLVGRLTLPPISCWGKVPML
jgi:hypothetical protein